MLGTAAAAEYAKAVEIVAKEKETDGMLIILTPQVCLFLPLLSPSSSLSLSLCRSLSLRLSLFAVND